MKEDYLKGKKQMIYKFIIGILVVSLAAGGYFTINYINKVNEYKKKVADISITDVDLSKIKDGSYLGSYDAILVGAKVRVDVSNHTIKNIQLLVHKNERGKRAEAIIGEIKSSQSLKVDTITGATNSSKVILKAVQNALSTNNK